MFFNTFYNKLNRDEKFKLAEDLKISKSYADAIASNRCIPSRFMKKSITEKTGLEFPKKVKR